MFRIASLIFFATLALHGVFPGRVEAQAFKNPIRVVVPQAPGGGTDLIARIVAQGLSKELGQPVVIENKPGASGQIGAQLVKNAAPDGTTFLCAVDHSMIIVPMIEPGARYDVAADFVALGQGAHTDWSLILPASASYKNFGDYVDAIKREPLARSYGVPLMNGAPGVVGNAIGKFAGVEMVEVPFQGSAPVLQNVMANQVPAGITGMPEAVNAERSGKARVAAVSGRERTSLFPDVPTFKELGVAGLDFRTFVGFFAPKGLPADMAEAFNAALRKSLADPEVQKKIKEHGMEPASTTLDEAKLEVEAMSRYWKRAIGSKR